MSKPPRSLIVFVAGLFLGGLLGVLFGRLMVPPPSLPDQDVSTVLPAPVAEPAPEPAGVVEESRPLVPTERPDKPTLPQPPSISPPVDPEVPAWQPPQEADMLIQQVGQLPGVVSVVWGGPAEVYVVVRGAELETLSQRVCQVLASAEGELLTIRFQDMGQEGADATVIRSCTP